MFLSFFFINLYRSTLSTFPQKKSFTTKNKTFFSFEKGKNKQKLFYCDTCFPK